MEIHYVDGVCGSFKTTRALEYAVKAAKRYKQSILFVQPTTKLITQSIETVARISSDVHVERFDSDACPGTVIKDLMKFMADWDADDNQGCIVFITHKCLWTMPYWHRKSNWHLIVDEIPDIDFEYHFNLPDTGDFAIQSILEADECDMNTMLRLKPRPQALAQVEHWAKNPGGDDLVKVIQPLFRELMNKYSLVYITRACWNRLGWQGHGQVSVHGWRAPAVCNGWQSVRILGAFFEQSLLYMIWSQFNVQFRQDHQIDVSAHRHDETLGKRVNIHFFSEKSWSKSLRDRIANEDDVLGKIKPLIKDLMGDDPFIWSANKDVPDTIIDTDFSNAIRIPAVCHGLNEYSHINKIVFLSALNNTPGHFGYLDKILGISSDQLRQARMFQVAYQSIMRTSLRDCKSSAEVTVFAPDIALGNWLTEVFPGSKLHAIKTSVDIQSVVGDSKKARGQPHKSSVLTGTERSARSYGKSKEIIRTFNTIYKVLNVRNQVGLTQEASVFSTNLHPIWHTDWDELRDSLLALHRQFVKGKNANTLISGALFDKDKSHGTHKGLDNITSVAGMWLDFDGGALLPDEFARMFSDVRWMMWNSYNHGKDGQSKYRVLLPTTTAMSADMYHAVWDTIAERIRSFGYYVGPQTTYLKRVCSGIPTPPQSGLDYSKRTACSFFYVPSVAGLGKKHTFWRDNWDTDLPLLDPTRWITYYAPLVSQEYLVKAAYQNPSKPSNDDRLRRLRDRLAKIDDGPDDLAAQMEAVRDQAIDDWRSSAPGTGNEAFYRLGCRLKASGMADHEVRQTLATEANAAQHPGERRAQISSIMKSLCRFTPKRAA